MTSESTATAPAALTMTGFKSSSATRSPHSGGQAGDRHDDVDERVDIGGWTTSRTFQQRIAPQRFDHLPSVGDVERQRPHRHIAQHLGEDAAGADQHGGTELAVVGDADDHLDAVGGHLLYEHAVDARRGVDLRPPDR